VRARDRLIAVILLFPVSTVGCASNGLFNGCFMTCSAPGPGPDFVPLAPELQPGQSTLMTYGIPGREARSYRGTWRSSDTRVVVVRRWSGGCYTACVRIEAVAAGEATIFFAPEGRRVELPNPVYVTQHAKAQGNTTLRN
jgi:hypothetical protein